MSKPPSDTFCVLPWMHIAVSPTGSYRVCCNSNPKNNKIMKTPDKEYKFFRDGVEEVWHSPDYVQIRKQFLAGERPETCQRCFREEDSGIRSPRIGYNEKWMRDDIDLTVNPALDIRYVDIRLGNLCNLKCRMCNPWSSSMWVKDWNTVVGTAELQPNAPLSDDDLDWMGKMGEWPDLEKTGVNFVDIADTIEEIYLTGGEPTLALSQYKLFDYCIEQGIAKNIRLKYNTNLTNVPPKMLEYWKHFKRVQLNASIDAIGERDRYIRYPSTWEKIEENFDKLNALPNVWIQLHCTVQVLNMCALHELLTWATGKGLTGDQIYLNILNHPECLNIRSLPVALKNLAKIRLMEWYHIPKVEDTIQYMWAEDWHDKRWPEFQAYNNSIDELQRGNLLDVCPEFKTFV